jgi:iron complex transport system ATP-binding protein
MLLQVEKITVQRGVKNILQDIDLHLHQGDLLVLLGGNGAGKSTLLQAIAGDLPLKQGNIRFKQKSLSKWNTEELAQERAVLSQKTPLHFSATLLDIVLMGRYPHRKKSYAPSIDQTIAIKALELVGLAHRATDDIQALSGGQQQRVQIARVLAQVWESSPTNPKVLFLDEPTAGLDINHQHLLLQLLQQKTTQKELTTMLVLHDMNLAAQYASKIALLQNGAIATIGTPKEVLTPHWIRQIFNVETTVQPHPTAACLQVSFIRSSTDSITTPIKNELNIY